MTDTPESPARAGDVLLPAVLRSRGMNNSLFDINRAADALDALRAALQAAEARADELEIGWDMSRMDWAGLVQDKIDALQAAEAREAELREVLSFYSDPLNWHPGKWPDDTTEDEPTESLICTDVQQDDEINGVYFADTGDRARAALTKGPTDARD